MGYAWVVRGVWMRWGMGNSTTWLVVLGLVRKGRVVRFGPDTLAIIVQDGW